ncbi:hypothetical protein CEG14_21235 [Bordetella genomosp. 1]|uniref:Uncharacterized protein n=1 Tax=Bordetella genomosp. 1 TaxID=1395607 RepID=A0A261RW45_9BORD|nr:hypothetical protein [Bordetella genomosp. 1]MDQ8035356.1 hypothetical protein [Bordetella sp.]OZI29155.1 hypothetical protein CEG14_21235 [Bordetella genomosp. 1]OZI65107.1 hypothetical protein CAL27_08545 [Bordetella genomosp. 1]
MDWKVFKSGWIGERNFEVETREEEAGYLARATVFGFPPLEVSEPPFPTEELAVKAALKRLSEEFDEAPRFE